MIKTKKPATNLDSRQMSFEFKAESEPKTEKLPITKDENIFIPGNVGKLISFRSTRENDLTGITKILSSFSSHIR